MVIPPAALLLIIRYLPSQTVFGAATSDDLVPGEAATIFPVRLDLDALGPGDRLAHALHRPGVIDAGVGLLEQQQQV